MTPINKAIGIAPDSLDTSFIGSLIFWVPPRMFGIFKIIYIFLLLSTWSKDENVVFLILNPLGHQNTLSSKWSKIGFVYEKTN